MNRQDDNRLLAFILILIIFVVAWLFVDYTRKPIKEYECNVLMIKADYCTQETK